MAAHAPYAAPNDPGHHAAAPASAAPGSAAPDPADPQGHRQALNTLVHMGTSIATLLHAQAHAQAAHPAPARQAQPAATQPAPAQAPNPLAITAAAFDRIARTVRRCIHLARILGQPMPAARTPAQARSAARRQVIRTVEDRIDTARHDGNPDLDAPEALRAELRDRLDAPDLQADLLHRPTADIIRDICRDLGLCNYPGQRPWRRRTPADIHALHAQAEAPTPPGSPRQPPGQAAPPHSGPRQDEPAPAAAPHQDGPAPAPRPHPRPTQPGSSPPDQTAAILAALLGPIEGQPRWRQPPSG